LSFLFTLAAHPLCGSQTMFAHVKKPRRFCLDKRKNNYSPLLQLINYMFLNE